MALVGVEPETLVSEQDALTFFAANCIPDFLSVFVASLPRCLSNLNLFFVVLHYVTRSNLSAACFVLIFVERNRFKVETLKILNFVAHKTPHWN